MNSRARKVELQYKTHKWTTNTYYYGCTLEIPTYLVATTAGSVSGPCINRKFSPTTRSKGYPVICKKALFAYTMGLSGSLGSVIKKLSWFLEGLDQEMLRKFLARIIHTILIPIRIRITIVDVLGDNQPEGPCYGWTVDVMPSWERATR